MTYSAPIKVNIEYTRGNQRIMRNGHIIGRSVQTVGDVHEIFIIVGYFLLIDVYSNFHSNSSGSMAEAQYICTKRCNDIYHGND